MESNLIIGFACLGLTILLIGLRVPVGLALGGVAVLGMTLIAGWKAALSIIKLLPFEVTASWELSAVPMFLLMGAIAFRAGLTSSLFEAARVWLGRLPGGVALAANFTCAGFAAASGSSLATTVAMGRIAVPEMLRLRYDPGLAAGLVASAGTLGSLIPPSVLLVVYGVFAETSISDLFIAGILPGILTAAVYGVMIVGRCAADPSLGPRSGAPASRREKWDALLKIWPLPLLVIGVVGGIYGGFATPTEAGAVGVVLAALIAALNRTLTWRTLVESLREAVITSAALLFVTIGAMMMIRLMALSGISPFLADLMRVAAPDPWLLILATSALFLVLGCFMEPIGLVLLTLPVLLPMYRALDLNLVWFGILVVKFVEIGLITPPIGMNVFAVNAVNPGIPIPVIFRGVMWFLLCELIVTGLLIAFPAISLTLPELMRG